MGLRDYGSDIWYRVLKDILHNNTSNDLYMYYCVKDNDTDTQQYINEIIEKLHIKSCIFVKESTIDNIPVNSTDIRKKIQDFITDIQKYIRPETLCSIIKSLVDNTISDTDS